MSEFYQSLSHSKWDCKYHVVFVPKYRRKAMFLARLYPFGRGGKVAKSGMCYSMFPDELATERVNVLDCGLRPIILQIRLGISACLTSGCYCSTRQTYRQCDSTRDGNPA